jgi:hypothetical protein
MRNLGPWPSIALGGALVVVALGVGRANGVGPLAMSLPPDRVTNPREMLTRSLQATLDADAVHIEGRISGTIPGAVVDRPEAQVSLIGSTIVIDIRPHDGKTRTHLEVPGLALSLDAITVWNDAWYRFSPDGPWRRTTAGDASAKAGVDINPLTFVDRLRAFLDTPGVDVVAKDVACASASSRCREVEIRAGSSPMRILAAALPDARGSALPDVPVLVTLQTDAVTLRPARLELLGVSGDGTIHLDLVLDASRWNGDISIDQPPDG